MTTDLPTIVCGHCMRTIEYDAYLVDGCCRCGQILNDDTILVFEDVPDD